MKRKEIKEGTYGVVLTPFDIHGRLEELTLRKELRYCCGTNTSGLLLCGSTSEFIYMTAEQQKEVLRIGMEEAGKSKCLIGGASAATERGVLEILNYMETLGYTYATVCPPYYYPQSPENIISFYEAISGKAPKGMKILMYNIPFCSPEIPLSCFERLLMIPNIIGMKDSSGNMLYLAKIMSLVEEKRPEFAVFTGQDATFLPSLTVGCSGCMSALAWMLDRADWKIWTAYQNNQINIAKEVQMKVMRMVRHLDEIAFPENYRVLSEVIGVSAGEPQRNLYNMNAEFCTWWIAKAVKLLEELK